MVKARDIKGLSCDDLKPLMQGFIHDRLTPVQRGTVLAHFLHCDRCAEAYHGQLDAAVARGEVRLPAPMADPVGKALELARRQGAFGLVAWPELCEALEAGSEWARKKAADIIRRLREAAAAQWAQPSYVAVRATTKGLRGTAMEEPLRAVAPVAREIKAFELDENWSECAGALFLEPQHDGIPRFTDEGRFAARFLLKPFEEQFAGRSVVLTVKVGEDPVLMLIGKLQRTVEKTLTVEFNEPGFEEAPKCAVPLASMDARILPPRAE